MSKPKVAVITRTKNRNLLLKRAIESVLNQTFQDWLMVIVNDGGDSKNVDDLVASHESDFKGRLKVIHNEFSNGMERASNIGIKASESDFVVIHDDDDSWNSEFLEESIKFLEERDAKGVITHSIKVIEEIRDNKVFNIANMPFVDWMVHISLYNMAAQNLFPPISFLYKREVFDKIGYYDESLPVLGDWEFNIRFMEKYDIHVLTKPLANYHHRPTSNDEAYSNTVCDLEKIKVHYRYDYQIRNNYLRKDMQQNKVGMGFLMNIGFSTEQGFLKTEKARSPFIVQKDEIKQRIAKNIEKLAKEYENKNIYLYGGGTFLSEIMSEHDLSKLNIKGVFDSNIDKAGQKIGDYTIYHSATMKDFDIDLLLFTLLHSIDAIHHVNKIYEGNKAFIVSL